MLDENALLEEKQTFFFENRITRQESALIAATKFTFSRYNLNAPFGKEFLFQKGHFVFEKNAFIGRESAFLFRKQKKIAFFGRESVFLFRKQKRNVYFAALTYPFTE